MQHYTIKLVLILGLVIGWQVSAATRLVPSQHATIQAAHNASSAGDIIIVSDGNYGERVTVTTSGLTFVGNATGTGVVMRGFTLNGVNFTKIIGFEMTHVNTSFTSGVNFLGTCSSNLIEGNYIHDINNDGIRHGTANVVSYTTIRLNTLYYMGHPGSLSTWAHGVTASLNAHHWLIEYNRFQRCGDFMDVYGMSNIFRNNITFDFDYSYWDWGGGPLGHSDMFQPGSDGAQTFTRHHLVENHLGYDSQTDHSHFCLFQDNGGAGGEAGDTNLTVRGAVIYLLGSGGIGTYGTEYVVTYNNTFFKTLLTASGGDLLNWFRSYPTVGGAIMNTLVLHMTPGNNAINVESSHTQFTEANNWGYAGGSESSYVGTTNPLLVDTNTPDLRLTVSSPLRGVARHITTITNASGSGTSFGVPDKHRLKDGWGLTEGDLVSFPGGGTARITAINWDTHVVTVASSITWTNNQRVYWGPRGYQADIGAYPHGAEFLTAASYTLSGGTATVATVGDARKVRRYRDGIPLDEDYDAPFTFAGHQSGDVYRAFAFYAQQNPVVTATEENPIPLLEAIPGAGKVNRATGQGF